MVRRLPPLWCLLLPCVWLGCREQAATWQALSVADLAQPARAAQQARAEQARTELAQTLLQRLTAAMQDGGPARAVGVCRDAAPELARSIGEKLGVRIGRTSFRLRNQANAAPVWASSAVAAQTTEPRFAGGPDGELGVLSPILTADPCLKCHGSAATIDPAVRTALTAAYPEDRALGFAAGDVRGYFWVEVPASR
ncbi:MAG: DUF3365 domain-containing protein [Planctomycetota bacterium]